MTYLDVSRADRTREERREEKKNEHLSNVDRLVNCNALINMASETSDYVQGVLTNQQKEDIHNLWSSFFKNYKTKLIISKTLSIIKNDQNAYIMRLDAIYKLTALLRQDEQALLAAFTELSIDGYNEGISDKEHHDFIKVAVQMATIYAITRTELLENINKISRFYISKFIYLTDFLCIVKSESNIDGVITRSIQIKSYRIYPVKNGRVAKEFLKAI